jgi:hypothetical protein
MFLAGEARAELWIAKLSERHSAGKFPRLQRGAITDLTTAAGIIGATSTYSYAEPPGSGFALFTGQWLEVCFRTNSLKNLEMAQATLVRLGSFSPEVLPNRVFATPTTRQEEEWEKGSGEKVQQGVSASACRIPAQISRPFPFRRRSAQSCSRHVPAKHKVKESG